MAIIKDSAPAKINLTLHVTGQRSDGYHLLDSLVVFAGICDEITATIAPDLQIKVGGPFAMGVPTDDTNLILRAAYALRAARGVTLGAHLTLEKNLPHAAGIGSGSSDAAMTLSMLAALWDVEPLSPKAPEVIALGTDVPVCMKAPSPIRMEGIGERLTLWPALPDCALVLVNPMVDVPTGTVFAGLKSKKNASMGTLPAAMDFDKFASWLSQQRNDLEAPARSIAPQVDDALKALGRMPQVVHAGMSGSGATCYGLVRTIGDARQVSRTLQVGNMGWWVAPAPLL